jgi:plastocyanin
MRRAPLLAATVLLALPGVAEAQTTHGVQAVDTVSASAWNPTLVQAEQGDIVRWTFEQPGNAAAQPHNVQLLVPGQSAPVFLGDREANSSQPIDYTADTLGELTYFCSIHGTMRGTLQVRQRGTSPSPPPVDTGPKALGNPSTQPGQLESGDFQRPRLRGLAVRARGNGVRVRFRLSEAGSVTVRFLRRGRAVKTVRLARLSAGRTTRTIRGVAAGRYRIELRAADRAGLRSARRTARVTIG